jgi:hypothetical protein
MEPGVSRELGGPFLAERQVERWRRATTALAGGELEGPAG